MEDLRKVLNSESQVESEAEEVSALIRLLLVTGSLTLFSQSEPVLRKQHMGIRSEIKGLFLS